MGRVEGKKRDILNIFRTKRYSNNAGMKAVRGRESLLPALLLNLSFAVDCLRKRVRRYFGLEPADAEEQRCHERDERQLASSLELLLASLVSVRPVPQGRVRGVAGHGTSSPG